MNKKCPVLSPSGKEDDDIIGKEECAADDNVQHISTKNELEFTCVWFPSVPVASTNKK